MTTQPLRVIGVPHKPTGALAVAPTIVTSIATLNSSDSAHLTQGAAGDVWAPWHLLIKTCLTIRQWVLNAEVADAALTPTGGNPGNMANVLLTGDLTLSEIPGGSRFVLTLTSIGAVEANTLTSMTLNNASGALTPLGLVEDGASKTVNAGGGVVTFTGDFQPRTLFVFPRSEQDTGDKRHKAAFFSHPLGDGDIDLFSLGNAHIRRRYSLIQQSPEFAGPSFPVGTFASWGGTRKVINVKTLTVNPTSIDAFNALDLLAVDDYVTIGNTDWCSRVKAANATSIDLWEPFPSSASVSAGEEIRVISEAAALEIEHRRIGSLVLYQQDDSTDLPMYGSYGVYAPFGEGKYEEPGSQPMQTEAIFDWPFELLKYRKAILTLP
jgi:hypothetical protein